jgi:hypothetical protein
MIAGQSRRLTKNTLLSCALVLLNACLSNVCLAAPTELTIMDIADANDQAISSVTSLIIDIHSEQEVQGSTPMGRCLSFHCRWIWQGGEMKIIQEKGPGAIRALRTDQQNAKHPTNTFEETYNGKNGYRSLMSYNPNKPPEISEQVPGGASGIITRERADPYPGVYPQRVLLFEIPYKNGSLRLASLVKERSCRIKATPASSQAKCYELEMGDENGNGLVISLDPRNNFTIRKVECRKKDGSLLYDGNVTSYHELPGNIKIPKEIVRHIHMGDNVVTTYTTTAVELLNQNIPNETFFVRFPPWLRVFDENTGRLYLWGDDEQKPFKTFESKDEYLKWYTDQMGPEPGRKQSRLVWWLFVCLVVLVLVFVVRRYRAHRRVRLSR